LQKIIIWTKKSDKGWQEWGKSTLHSPFFGSHNDFFMGESSIVGLYSNLFEKLGKSDIQN
jgi:hypothetical protein